MEEAAAVRRAAVETVGDIEPERLRADIVARIEEASMAPGVLTLLSARSAPDAESQDGFLEIAAGVQLVYEGLRLTRQLAHEEPWRHGDERARADVAILVADVLVARGFVLLARTDASDVAVSMVRAFGRDQTLRRTAEDPRQLDANLEVDVLRLAIVAGHTAAGGPAPRDAEALARDLVERNGGSLPPTETLCSTTTRDRLDGLVAADGSGVRTHSE